MKKLLLLILLFSISSIKIKANNLKISNLSFNDVNNTISFDVQWNNSWHDATGNFHDAVWVFVKYRTPGAQWKHANIQFSGTSPVDMAVITPVDKKGAFIRRSAEGLGNITQATYKFDVLNSLGVNPSFKVFGIEMVYIPFGAFYIGGSTSIGGGAFLHDPNDSSAGVLIQSESMIPASAYTVSGNNYFVDDIPASFPKGYASFYCMKYKISQIQYVEFLNTLNASQQNQRVAVDLYTNQPNRFVMSDTYHPDRRNGIYLMGNSEEGNYKFGSDLNNNGIINEADDGMDISCNFLGFEDQLAYLDWAALRMPTRLEYWKICRGPELAIDSEYAWGTNINNEIDFLDIVNTGTSNEALPNPLIGPRETYFPVRVGIFATPTSNRYYSGASYYGVMDISIGMTEYCVDIKGNNLNFTNDPGDGNLSGTGDSDGLSFTRSCVIGQFNINRVDGQTYQPRNPLETGRGVR